MSNFSKGFKDRLLSPRLLIYVILAVGSAFFMTKYGPKEEARQKSRQADSVPRQKFESLSSVDDKIPMVLVFCDANQADDLVPVIEKAREIRSRCRIMLITTAHDDLNSAAAFGVTTRPCAILIDGGNQELGRVCGDGLSYEDFAKLLNSLPAEE